MSLNPCKTIIDQTITEGTFDPDALQNDLDACAAKVIAACKKAGLTIASCESFTAGLFAATLGSIPGASSVLCGGLVTYQTPYKISIAYVPADVIETYGVISKECARAMAVQTLGLFDCSLAVSFTGNAGPDAMEGKPAGLVYVAIAWKTGQTTVYELHCDLPRNALRQAAVGFILARIEEQLPVCAEGAAIQ